MSAPVYRDPVFDGATDPAVIRHDGTGDWWMFYTQRRASLDGTGVEWVHGSRIGIAVSSDGGASWSYRGVVDGLDPSGGRRPNTHWAPEVVRAGGEYHLYLTWISGAPSVWAGHQRSIVHFTSEDLETWTRAGELELSSDQVIDAAVAETPDGRYRLWYKDEADDSSTWVAVSEDLARWAVEGRAVGGPPHEGPNIFALGGWWWMITDEWCGQRVHRSVDALTWQRRGLILDRPGRHPLDRQVGRHADVVVRGDDAAVFYFTHPFWNGSEIADAAGPAARKSAIHVATVRVHNGELECDRDPVLPVLLP